jgi:glycosyltransferase involved in cell wall biosynthesis
VESALAQTWQNTEVVVVDDASGDDTPDRLREIDDPRLRVIVQPENRGVAAARNAGIAAARGDMIAFLDSDDVWRPEKIARQARALAAAPAHVGLCQCGSETMARDGGTIIHRPEAGGRMFVALLRQNVLHGGGSTVMVRREVTEAIGGFDEGLPAAEDWEFFQRAARLFDVTCVPEPLAVIRDDTPGPRRSARFRANMDARAAIFSRNRHALRRARVAHLFLIDSSRRELRSPEGSARRGTLLALRAIAERPFARSAWVQMRHCLALRRLGRQLRAAISRPRRMMGQLEPTKTVAPSTGVADQHGSR